ncbi:uncharacterized protein METZ01_LOCUS177723 [marine metagenome]|uniref:Uncharacterized protein n=1 Tax=marine metagenome TaxID=408172 RepID=A0A382CG94_9ZZZZ
MPSGKFLGSYFSCSSIAGPFSVITGQPNSLEYFQFQSTHLAPGSVVSECFASIGHSGSQTPQSIHSSGLITSVLIPS